MIDLFNGIDEKQIQILDFQVANKTNLICLCWDNFFRAFDLKSGRILSKFGDHQVNSRMKNLISNSNFTIQVHDTGVIFYSLENFDLEKSLNIKKMKYLDPIGLFENCDILCLPQYNYDIEDGSDDASEDRTDDESEDRTDDDRSEDDDELSFAKIVDYNTGKVSRNFNVKGGYDFDHVDLLSDQEIVSFGSDGLQIWDIETGEYTTSFHAFDDDFGSVTQLKVGNGGKLICLIKRKSYYRNTDEKILIRTLDMTDCCERRDYVCKDFVTDIKSFLQDNLAISVNNGLKLNFLDLNHREYFNSIDFSEYEDFFPCYKIEFCYFFPMN